jgi:hypothetical protein
MNKPGKASGHAELLPDELLWADGGHASDVVLTALADGEIEIVPPRVRAHVDGCALCTQHLGNAALLSVHAQEQIAFMAEQARNEAIARLPVPRLAIILGLLVAFLGFLPTLLEAGTGKELTTFARDVPVLVNGLRQVARGLSEPGSSLSLVLTYGAAFLMVGIAIAVVRFLPKKEFSR